VDGGDAAHSRACMVKVYDTTDGYCRGGPKWDVGKYGAGGGDAGKGGDFWLCLGRYTVARCQQECENNDDCGAFDIESSSHQGNAGSNGECCLFMPGHTGNGEGGGVRSCFVKRNWQTGAVWKKGDPTHRTQKKDGGGGSQAGGPTGGGGGGAAKDSPKDKAACEAKGGGCKWVQAATGAQCLGCETEVAADEKGAQSAASGMQTPFAAAAAAAALALAL